MAKSRISSFWAPVALLPIPILWCLLLAEGGLDGARNWAVDMRIRARGEIASDVKVVYVDMDDRSIDEIGGVPWTRDYYALVCRTLIEEAGVRAIGIDLVLSENGIPESVDRERMILGNREFGQYLWGNPPVVLAAAFSASQFRDINGVRSTREIPYLATDDRVADDIEPPELPSFNIGGRLPFSPAGVGLIDTYLGDTRWVPLFAPTMVRTYYHLSVELLRRYWGLGPEGVQVTEDELLFVQENGAVLRRVPLTDRQLVEVNWFSRWRSEYNPRISFVETWAYAKNLMSDNPEAVESARAFFAQDAFRDAIVLIGPVDALLQDLGPTSFTEGNVPKVGVHGNMVKTIANEQFFRRLTKEQGFALVFLLTIFTTGFAVAGGARSVLARVLAVILVAGYIVAGFALFINAQLVLPLVAPVGSALSTTFVAVAWQYMQEQKAKNRMKGMFGTYLSPIVVNQMVESGRDPELGGHDAEITPYFSDIQSFSAFSEVLTSSQLGELLNEYLTVCTEIIQGEGGTLDKYIGDAVVAMFGAPVDLEDHAFKACIVSQLVQRRLDELRQKWISEGDKWPNLVHEMRTRIGLNTGPCMIGNMGSTTRFNYTMMGDNVNLAARMESGAKSWGAFTMVTESTKLACEKHGAGQIVFRPLGRIVVKGRSQPVPIHEIMGLVDDVTAEGRECLELFHDGMDRYYQRDWSGAAECFKRSESKEPWQPGRDGGVKANPSLVYQKIVAEMAANPPADDWDGVYVMTEK